MVLSMPLEMPSLCTILLAKCKEASEMVRQKPLGPPLYIL